MKPTGYEQDVLPTWKYSRHNGKHIEGAKSWIWVCEECGRSARCIRHIRHAADCAQRHGRTCVIDCEIAASVIAGKNNPNRVEMIRFYNNEGE